MKHANRRVGLVLACAVVAAVVLMGCARRGLVAETVAATGQAKPVAGGAATSPINPLDPQRAYGYLKEICALGPRMSGSAGMKKQQALVQAHFEKLGGKVTMQPFLANNPLNGEKVRMANMLIEWHPERKDRILLVAHDDTRPLPDNDPDPAKRRNGTFIGANDGGSGVALLMELAHLMPKLEGPIGVDFLLVDGEELVYTEGRDPYFLGATWFSQKYVKEPPDHKYRWGVVLDMVGDSDLQMYQEKNSVSWRDTRPLVNQIWGMAARLGVREFMPLVRVEVQDDHLPLRGIANIPTCDLIDFIGRERETPPAYWHTTADTPEVCSGESLAKVGWVVYEWLRGLEAAKPVGAGK